MKSTKPKYSSFFNAVNVAIMWLGLGLGYSSPAQSERYDVYIPELKDGTYSDKIDLRPSKNIALSFRYAPRGYSISNQCDFGGAIGFSFRDAAGSDFAHPLFSMKVVCDTCRSCKAYLEHENQKRSYNIGEGDFGFIKVEVSGNSVKLYTNNVDRGTLSLSSAAAGKIKKVSYTITDTFYSYFNSNYLKIDALAVVSLDRYPSSIARISPVYRLSNAKTGDHFFTTSFRQYVNGSRHGYTPDGLVFQILASSEAVGRRDYRMELEPLYRYRNDYTHTHMYESGGYVDYRPNPGKQFEGSQGTLAKLTASGPGNWNECRDIIYKNLPAGSFTALYSIEQFDRTRPAGSWYYKSGTILSTDFEVVDEIASLFEEWYPPDRIGCVPKF